MTALPESLLLTLRDVQPERVRSEERPPWSDTVPACFRSEAFAEDLLDSGDDNNASAQPQRPPRLSALSVMPVLGTALALTLGWIGR